MQKNSIGSLRIPVAGIHGSDLPKPGEVVTIHEHSPMRGDGVPAHGAPMSFPRGQWPQHNGMNLMPLGLTIFHFPRYWSDRKFAAAFSDELAAKMEPHRFESLVEAFQAQYPKGGPPDAAQHDAARATMDGIRPDPATRKAPRDAPPLPQDAAGTQFSKGHTNEQFGKGFTDWMTYLLRAPGFSACVDDRVRGKEAVELPEAQRECAHREMHWLLGVPRAPLSLPPTPQQPSTHESQETTVQKG